MATAVAAQEGAAAKAGKILLKRELTLLPLFGFIYFTVCGGSFGTEQLGSMSGPGLMFVMFIVPASLKSAPPCDLVTLLYRVLLFRFKVP